MRLERRVERILREKPILLGPEGRRVFLANPDNFNRKGPSVLTRAVHLVTEEKASGIRNPDPSRVPWVGAVPKTIQDPGLILEGFHKGNRGLGRTYFLKQYKDGAHLVITDRKGLIIDQGNAEGLLTQYQPNLAKDFDGSFRVAWAKKRNPEGGASGGSLPVFNGNNTRVAASDGRLPSSPQAGEAPQASGTVPNKGALTGEGEQNSTLRPTHPDARQALDATGGALTPSAWRTIYRRIPALSIPP